MRHAQAGFSMVELCVGVMLLAIVGGASFAGIHAEQLQRMEAEEERAAALLAASLLERARAGAIRPVGVVPYTMRDVDRRALGEAEAHVEFRRSERGLVEARVVVTWQRRAGSARGSFVLTTWLCTEGR